jgi:putative tryptophan/tyrosine transport system substrate-binding protein
MRRRDFIAGLGSAAAWPMVARAEQAAVAVAGALGGVVGTMERSLPSFSQGLADTGLIRGVSD